jgi:thioredoxin reductase (NADPH)
MEGGLPIPAHAESQVPVLIVVLVDVGRLADLKAVLQRRFGSDYEIVGSTTSADALARLSELTAAGREAALVIAGRRLADTAGAEFLADALAMAPDVSRGLLVDWAEAWSGDPDARGDLVRASVLGQFDRLVFAPTADPDEAFFAGISELLDLWARRRHAGFAAVQVVGERWSAETHQLHDLLERSSIPAAFHEPDSPDGQRLLRLAGAEARVPVAVFHDGRILVQPTAADIAMAIGANAAPAETRFDLVVVGAGPAGLAAAVYGASEGLDVLVIDQDTHGGQAGTSSLIRNYLGFTSGISGQDLAARAYRQAYFLGSRFLFGRRAADLRADGDDRVVALDDGTEIRGRAVILATGVEYRRLGVPRLEQLVGRGVYYGAATSEAPAMRGQDVIVVGGANSAGQAAVHLCRFARSITLVVRGPSIEETMSEYLVREIDASGKVVVLTNTEIVDARGEQRLAAVTLRDTATGLTTERPVTAAFILIGAVPRTEWLPTSIHRDDQGFILTGSDASSSPSRAGGSPVETSMAGVFAVGDARAGSTKRIAAAVGDGSMAVRYVHDHLARLADDAAR